MIMERPTFGIPIWLIIQKIPVMSQPSNQAICPIIGVLLTVILTATLLILLLFKQRDYPLQ